MKLAVLWLDRESEEVVREINLGHVVSTAKEISHCVQTFHPEVSIPQVVVERTKIEATSHLGRVLLRN